MTTETSVHLLLHPVNMPLPHLQAGKCSSTISSYKCIHKHAYFFIFYTKVEFTRMCISLNISLLYKVIKRIQIRIRAEPHTMNLDCGLHLSSAGYPIFNSSTRPHLHFLISMHVLPIYQTFIDTIINLHLFCHLPLNPSTPLITTPTAVLINASLCSISV